MDATTYQKLALRTECDQIAALARLAGLAKTELPTYGGDQLEAIRFLHGALGVAKEGGELLSVYEKWIHYGKTFSRKEMKERILDEAGDVLWYLSLALSSFGIPLQEVMEANIRKLQVRYPDRYSDECAADENRDREKERAALRSTSRIEQDGHGFGHVVD